MKYAVVAAAIAGAVSALPAEEWNTWSTTTTSCTTTSTEEWNTWTTTTTTPKAEWTPVPIKSKCSYLTTYTTEECGDDKAKWDNCKVATKTSTVYTDAEKCTWAPWPTTTPAAPVWTPVEVKTKEKCSYTSTYVTTEYDEKKEWETAKVVTKTTVIYTDADKCTWAPWSSATTPAASTWASWSAIPVTTKTPVAATTEWNTWKASSTVSAPVAKWTGAADKNTFAMGALAVAGLAALL